MIQDKIGAEPAARESDCVLTVASAFAESKVADNNVTIGLARAVRELRRIAVNRDRAGRRLAGDVIVRQVLDVEATCKLDGAADVEDDDFVCAVLNERAAQRAGAAVV